MAGQTFEGLIDQLGNPGRFQVIMLLILYTMEIPVAWATMMMSFAGKIPDWWCVEGAENSTADDCPDCNNVTYKNCSYNNNSQCSSFYFDQGMNTLVSEWSLVCDKSAITATVTSIQMAGNLVGAILCGQISDTFGRRIALYLNLLILVVSSTLAGFATSWQMFSACTFFVGISCGGYLVTYFPQAVEFVRSKWRTVVGVFPFWSIGFAIFGLIAWPTHDYKILCFIIAGTGAPFLLTFGFFPESVRWLLARGRVSQAEKTICRIAKMNRIATPDLTDLSVIAEEEKKLHSLKKKYTYFHLYNSARKLKTTIIFNIMWCICSVVYYGLTFGARNLVGNIYLNICLSGLVELPRVPIIILLNDRIGRRWTCFCFFLLCSVCCLVIAICSATGVHNLDAIHFGLALTAKMSITAGWAALKIFTAENYPTVVRTLAAGSCNIAAGIGSVIAPYVVLMTEKDLVVPYIVIGVLVLANVGLPFLLRETMGQPLEDTFISDNSVNFITSKAASNTINNPDTKPLHTQNAEA